MDPNVLRSFSAEMKKEALLGTLLTMPLRASFAGAAMRRDADTKRSKELRDRLVKDDPTEVRILPQGSLRGPSYAVENKRQYVNVRSEEDPAVLAHELGHSELDRSIVGAALQSGTLEAATSAGRFGAVLGSGLGLRPTIGAAIAAASLLPTLAYEGAASIKGLNRLARAGATKEELANARSKLLNAWGSYATLPVAAAGDALTAALIRRAVRG